MRELIFKNLTSQNKLKRDLYLTETIDKNGIRTITKRHSTYVVDSHKKIEDPTKLKKIKQKVPLKTPKRHVFIFKKQDTKNKKDVFVCDVVGKFYAVVRDEIYSIGFKHSFEIDFLCMNKL